MFNEKSNIYVPDIAYLSSVKEYITEGAAE